MYVVKGLGCVRIGLIELLIKHQKKSRCAPFSARIYNLKETSKITPTPAMKVQFFSVAILAALGLMPSTQAVELQAENYLIT